ncbi:MAG: hypothetical protein U1C18_01915 [Patescibacteria group bacterium]|nr:hypothetical protein [bacterium]MDZ4221607.1 hypothetical protein [Patescibacteria group bacterium]
MATQPKQYTIVSVEDLMRTPSDVVDSISWRWANADNDPGFDVGWMTYALSGTYVVGRLYHLVGTAFDNRAKQARRTVVFVERGRPGLGFRIVTTAGTCAFVLSADSVKKIFEASRAPLSTGGFGRPRIPTGLLDAMQQQSDHQVGLESSML